MEIVKKGMLYAIIGMLIASCQNDDAAEYETLPDLSERLYAGGQTTTFSATSNAFGYPAPNLSAAELQKHLAGDLQFVATFITAPAPVNPGLGPLFNNVSCIACHPKDGRAAHPSTINSRNGLLVRVSIPGMDEHGGPLAVPGFGLQIQNHALAGYLPEADYQVTYIQKTETLADGTVITLRKPIISLTNPYISLPPGVMLSARLGPPVFGLGLLEAIPEADIIAYADPNDWNGDGISGKANYVWDSYLHQMIVGRFGWKANTGTIHMQCASAYLEDMGITSSVFPQETGHNQSNGNDGQNDDPELSDEIMEQIVMYSSTLAVPAPRGITNSNVREGAQIFEQLDCAKCHVPRQRTGYSPISALAFQTFYPYTDLLLHDMGPELADQRPDYLADGSEWKTRPLWGLGLTQLVNGHTDLLHDGRARNITEAILWHGGEAQNAKEKFKQLPTARREALLAFLNSL